MQNFNVWTLETILSENTKDLYIREKNSTTRYGEMSKSNTISAPQDKVKGK